MSPSLRRQLVRFFAIAAVLAIAWYLSPAADDSAQPSDAERWTVEFVIDGDTLMASRNGVEETVRFIGIDTPEIGECGYSEASAALRDLVRAGTVDLVAGAETDRDSYDRLLRYVEVDGVDVGRRLIDEGFARARYDYRTGQPHDREDAYIAADAASPSFCS